MIYGRIGRATGAAAKRTVVSLCLLPAILVSVGTAAQAAGPVVPITIANERLSLSFDPRTGGWTDLVDRVGAESLVTGPRQRAMVDSGVPLKLDMPAIGRAVASGAALSLLGDWLYTPAAQPETAATAFLQGRFTDARWEVTPVPSRRGVGDDRLNNRIGDFWYRREFRVPAQWPASASVVILIGAVDDFDTTYVNGIPVGSIGLETPHFWEAPRYYRIPTGLLRRDGPNVLLVKDRNEAYSGGISGPVVIGLETALPDPVGIVTRMVRAERIRRGATTTLRLTARSDDYEYQMLYALRGGRPAFSRRLSVRNITGREQLLQTTALTTPFLRVGPAQCAIFPGTLPVGDLPIGALHEGESRAPRSQDPLVVLWDSGKRRGVGSWYRCEEEYAPVSIRRSGDGLRISHSQDIIVRLKPGQSVELGEQYFWLAHGTRDSVLRGVQNVYREIGLHAPARGLAGLRGKTLYCGHPGGTPEQQYIAYGGFRVLQAYVPTLRKMGIDLMWLLPIWEHGDGKTWNLYAPFDHFRVSSLYGTPDDLKHLSAACAESGIHLIFDMVPHGPPDNTPLAKAHPEWACHTREGTMQYAWSELAFDNAHPGWQDYMRRAAAWDAREYGGVGARVDCGAGSPPNWNPEVGNRPSHSSLAGALGMNRAIRDGFLQAHPDAVLLPEEYTGANIFYRVADLTYDAQLYFLMADLQAQNAAPEEWARSLRDFLRDQQLALPPGALKMRWISNHDTVSWTFQKQRPASAFGVDRMRALLAMCAFVEGVPMLYQGDENPALYGGHGVSNVDFLARIYGLRRRLPALQTGTADYTSIRATEGVFTCLRRAKSQEALALISFNPDRVVSSIIAPANLRGKWFDAETGEPVLVRGAFQAPMQPHEVRVLVRAVSNR